MNFSDKLSSLTSRYYLEGLKKNLKSGFEKIGHGVGRKEISPLDPFWAGLQCAGSVISVVKTR